MKKKIQSLKLARSVCSTVTQVQRNETTLYALNGLPNVFLSLAEKHEDVSYTQQNTRKFDNFLTTQLVSRNLENLIKSTIKRKLQQLNSNPVHTVKKCCVYLHIPWIGKISTKFEKQITSAVKRWFFSVEPRIVFRPDNSYQ